MGVMPWSLAASARGHGNCQLMDMKQLFVISSKTVRSVLEVYWGSGFIYSKWLPPFSYPISITIGSTGFFMASGSGPFTRHTMLITILLHMDVFQCHASMVSSRFARCTPLHFPSR